MSSVLKALGRDLSSKMDSANIQDTVLSLQRIEFSLGILPINQVEEVNDLLRPILSRILAGVEKLSKNMDEPKNTIPALNLANHILNLLKKESGEFYNEETELSANVDKFNNFFSVL